MKPKNRDEVAFYIFPAEVEHANQLGAALAVIARHQSSLRMNVQDLEIEARQGAYVESPNDVNFQAFKSASIDRELCRTAGPRISVTIESAYNRCLLDKFLPFVIPVLSRNLELAKANLAEIVKAEDQAHVERFGIPVENSVRISHARGLVADLEGLLATASKNAAPSECSAILTRILGFPVQTSAEA